MVVPSSTRREEVLRLIYQKNKIEQEINENGQILTANNIGMNEPLIDELGYPRNDIDVYQVRHARHQIICLQNDLKDLLKEIENGLADVHAEARARNDIETESTTSQIPDIQSGALSREQQSVSITSISGNTSYARPFVKVNVVTSGSPAENAGIQLGDEIIDFGSINADNFTNLMQVGDLVKSQQNAEITVRVKRNNGQIYQLTLVPKIWSGRGLLGCNIIPIIDSIS